MTKFAPVSLSLTALAFSLAVAVAPQAAASGFQLRDQSGSGQGTSYAGVSAGGSDISSMFFNPAAMVRFDGNQLMFGFTQIQPDSKLSNGSATESGYGLATTTVSGATSTGNIASSATLPTLYAMWSVDSDLKLGLSVNVPFGLTTSYDPSWAGRYQAIRSHLETLDITPSVAYRVGSQWSVGAAIIARRATAELSQAIDLGYESGAAFNVIVPGQPVFAPGNPANDGTVDVQGSSWAYGYKLGLLFEPSTQLHIGLGYQSRVRETLKGNANFSLPANAAANLQAGAGALAGMDPAQAGAIGAEAQDLAGAVSNAPVTAVLHLPSTLSLGILYNVSATFDLSAEIAQTKWSCFKDLTVNFNQPGRQNDVTDENWKDATFIALGATCHPGNAWTYRVGVAKDNTPVPDVNRTARIPDADRTWLSGGASYQFTKRFGMDAGYSHLFCKDSSINLQEGNSEAFRGNLSGTYKNTIDILSVSARLTF